ncbi:MAG: 16S rRNA (guanine(527)-N(7))-methyltransferase RsmG [Gemmatimonadaceae bacterium]
MIPTDLTADRSAFLESLPAAGDRAPSSLALEQLDRFALLLYERIPTLALISKGDRTTLYTRHILDALNPLSLFDQPPECALDIGSGGGLPGVPLAIVWPSTRVVLLESREKKGAFLERTVRAMGLRNVKVACERLEEHARKGEPVYDAVFVRAVADTPRLIDEIAPRCLPRARWVYFAGGGVDLEQFRRELAVVGRTADEGRGLFGGRLLHGLV